MRFGEKLVKLRKSKGYTQEELAEKLGVSRQAVSRWEAGETSPDINTLAAVCDVFCVSADYMINDDYDIGENVPAGFSADCEIHDSYTVLDRNGTESKPAKKNDNIRHLIAAVCYAIAAYFFLGAAFAYANMIFGSPLPFILRLFCAGGCLAASILQFRIFFKNKQA